MQGTIKSSSIIVKMLIKFMNSLKAAGDMLRLTSSVIIRGRRTACAGTEDTILSRSVSQDFLRKVPREKMYSLESRMSSNFIFPKYFAIPADFRDYFGFFHFGHRRLDPSGEFSGTGDMPFGFSNVIHGTTSFAVRISLLEVLIPKRIIFR